MCTGNEIKSTPGDATNCSADVPCDGTTSVPNAEHSACGESKPFRILQDRQLFHITEERIFKIRCYWSLHYEIAPGVGCKKRNGKGLDKLNSSSKKLFECRSLE